MKIRVMLAEDRNLVRQGIWNLLKLSDNIEVIGQVENGSEVLEGLRKYKLDLLLTDIQMPKMTGIEALKLMQEKNVMVATIILTTFDDNQPLLEGMQAGAKGFLLKDVSLDSLVNAIERVYQGETRVQPAITERVLKGLSGFSSSKDEPALANDLSIKEMEVLRLMAGGYSNREISLAIHKSEGTVKKQVSSILEKLGVRERTQAVLRAINLSLL